MLWKPEPMWAGLDAFVIGGGDSLRTFDFSLLIGERTVGCNNAYAHGPKICNICIFGDKKWFDVHHERLEVYVNKGGFVVTNDNKLANCKVPWLHRMERRPRGLYLDALGWNTNTGSSAVNLALILGARTVYLLGFDRKLKKGRPNWHDELIDKPSQETYQRMNSTEGYMARDLNTKFPGRKVINVTDNSTLPHWPKVPISEFWNERKKDGRDSNDVRQDGGRPGSGNTAAGPAAQAVSGRRKVAG
jgi:hypothetical protein